MDETYTPATNSQPTLADLLTIESSASIFYSYAREVELSRLFADPDAESTLLVPTNKAVMALPRKPYVHNRCVVASTLNLAIAIFRKTRPTICQ